MTDDDMLRYKTKNNTCTTMSLKLNRIIMHTAIQSKSDSENGWIMLYWTTILPYTFAYIEDVKTNTFHFRIFKCQDITTVQEYSLLHPNYADEKIKCLYDSSEHEEKRNVSYCEDFSTWLKDAMRAAERYLE